jgi:C4-dicarboxylate transporter DctM subunit
MGGITAGIFTPTEAAAVAVFYTLMVSFFIHRDMKLKDLPSTIFNAAVTCSSVMLIVASASLFAWLITTLRFPAMMYDFLSQYISSTWVLLLLINLILFIAGMFENGSAALVMFVPVLYPLALNYGVDPIHFGLVCVLNLVIGGLTPPVGIVLFVTSSVGGIRFEALVKACSVPIAILIAVLMICTYMPAVVLWFPNLFF